MHIIRFYNLLHLLRPPAAWYFIFIATLQHEQRFLLKEDQLMFKVPSNLDTTMIQDI